MAGASRASSGLEALLSPVNAVKVLLVGAALVGVFHQWLLKQHLHSWGNPDWSHSHVVPLVSLYLLWQAREELSRARARVFWPGLMVVVMGVMCYVMFLVGISNHMGQGFSFILTLFGVVLMLTGPEVTRWAVMPIGYLVFGVTVSKMVMIKLTAQLQLVASKGAWMVLNSVGVSTDIKGNILEVTSGSGLTHQLNIAEACAGMRMVIAFVALGAAVALVGCREWWQRAALLMLAIPVAVLVNVVRVASLGVMTLVNPDLASGSAHMFIGMLWLVPGFLLYMLIMWVLNRLVRGSGASEKGVVS